jgi:hypothetical protein
MRHLKEVAEAFKEKCRNVQYLRNIRWVASKVSAGSGLVKDCKCITEHRESIAGEKTVLLLLPRVYEKRTHKLQIYISSSFFTELC